MNQFTELTELINSVKVKVGRTIKAPDLFEDKK